VFVSKLSCVLSRLLGYLNHTAASCNAVAITAVVVTKCRADYRSCIIDSLFIHPTDNDRLNIHGELVTIGEESVKAYTSCARSLWSRTVRIKTYCGVTVRGSVISVPKIFVRLSCHVSSGLRTMDLNRTK
jgi:hypothetical protein